MEIQFDLTTTSSYSESLQTLRQSGKTNAAFCAVLMNHEVDSFLLFDGFLARSSENSRLFLGLYLFSSVSLLTAVPR